jgi:hypothetical protein
MALLMVTQLGKILFLRQLLGTLFLGMGWVSSCLWSIWQCSQKLGAFWVDRSIGCCTETAIASPTH